jgi:hypothetical protein
LNKRIQELERKNKELIIEKVKNMDSTSNENEENIKDEKNSIILELTNEVNTLKEENETIKKNFLKNKTELDKLKEVNIKNEEKLCEEVLINKKLNNEIIELNNNLKIELENTFEKNTFKVKYFF